MKNNKVLIAVLLENEAGSLSRVIGLFSQRNFNIESLTVAPTNDKTLSRLTITTLSDDSEYVQQITKQLEKLVPVFKIAILSEKSCVERELALIKVSSSTKTDKTNIQFILDIYPATVVNSGSNYVVLQLVSTACVIDACLQNIGDNLIESTRTGAIGLVNENIAL